MRPRQERQRELSRRFLSVHSATGRTLASCFGLSALFADQGIYHAINNLSSLAARFIFAHRSRRAATWCSLSSSIETKPYRTAARPQSTSGLSRSQAAAQADDLDRPGDRVFRFQLFGAGASAVRRPAVCEQRCNPGDDLSMLLCGNHSGQWSDGDLHVRQHVAKGAA
ncbi:hypothetical protein L1887_58803 [Cichorium endivia]|nr:hypothetical protein L1887_58803 [Cichorium endivia]